MHESVLEYFVTNYRGIFCLLFILPVSVIYNAYLKIRSFCRFSRRNQSVVEHNKKVQKWISSKSNKTMCTSRPGWQAMSLRVGKYKKTSAKIKIDMDCIVSLDTENKVVVVEPMVTIGQLTAALNPLGWTLPVVPELDDLTIGGVIAGVGVETSSHIYGLFQHICIQYEVVLADSTVVVCSASERPDLFFNIPWSHGTLGFVVSATIKIIPCKQYVRLIYIPFNSKANALTLFKNESERGKTKNSSENTSSPYDFIEAIAFSPSSFVVMLGMMVDQCEVETNKLNEIGRFWKPWFYTHVAETLYNRRDSTPRIEYIPLRHYYHRHTRSLFWEVSDIIPFGNDKWFRFLFGWMMPPKPALLKLTQTEALRALYEKHHVVQDMLIPIKDIYESLEVFDRAFNIYPLWLCPLRILSTQTVYSGLITASGVVENDLFVDIGAYGNPKSTNFNAEESCRIVEEYVRRKGGFQMLYADTYMTRDEFRQMFNHEVYDRLRKEIPYTAVGFPDIYDKICKKNRI